jgi:exo-1,4-beta-D-glucosaminidase
LDYNASTWYHTPQTAYADLKGLNTLKPGKVAVTASSTRAGENVTTSVTVTNTATDKAVAFFLRASIRKGAGGAEVLPSQWTDNYVTLWPGETITLRSDYRASDLGGATPRVEVSGNNVPKTTVSAPVR